MKAAIVFLVLIVSLNQLSAEPNEDLLQLLRQKTKTYAEVEALLKQGASANARSGLSWTALMYATDDPRILELLINRGAEVNATNKSGRTALMYAASFGRADSVKILLKYGANSALQDKQGNTALTLAESRGKTEAAALLRVAQPAIAQNSPMSAQLSAGSGLEAEILAELNLARNNPRKYAQFLREHLANLKDGIYQDEAGRSIATKEGASAVREAIAALESANPVPALQNSQSLALAAADHARDMGAQGKFGHTGTDASSTEQRIQRYGQWQKSCAENITYGISNARSIVMALVIDDGVASRGHRKNILYRDFAVAGIACKTHATRSPICVMDFAGGMIAK